MEVEVLRAMTVTVKEEARRARRMWGPRLPPACGEGVSDGFRGGSDGCMEIGRKGVEVDIRRRRLRF